MSLRASVLLCGFLVACGGEDEPEPVDPCNLPTPAIETPELHTPRWAFEPWISKDISDGADTRAFVEGFEERDIPVGVVVLDSPWETHYNTFVPNPDRYPDFEQLVSDLREKEIRVVLWITPLVNVASWDLEPGGDVYVGPSPNFEEGERCGFFVDEAATHAWWKGKGAAVDFFDPKAAAWWHRQQNTVLDAGVAGWKLDFGEEYIKSNPIETAKGGVTKQEYSEEYYRDFLSYGVARRGPEDFLTMVRPYDRSYGFPGRFYARPEHAPVAWVGDNRRDWVGLSDALDHLFRSAAAGYVVIGSDIGGYLDRDDENLLGKPIPFDTLNFARWTALGALTPFMQLHGRANIAPWTVPDHVDETVELYRYWATLHHELVPFFYSLAELGEPILRPVGQEKDWPGDYRFELGEAFLVAPLLDASPTRDVPLPAGSRWLDFWDLAGEWKDGGTTLTAYDSAERRKIPLFVREGAIVPLEVSSSVTGIGSAGHAGKTTLLAFPGPEATSFVLHDADGKTTEIGTTSKSLTLSRAARPVIARVRLDAAPSAVSGGAPAVSLDALLAGASGHFYDAAARALWVLLPASEGPASVTW